LIQTAVRALDGGNNLGVHSGTDGADGAARSHEEDDMSKTAGTVVRASRLPTELAGR